MSPSFDLYDIKWFAENAHRQRVGPLRVLSMAEGCYWYLDDSTGAPNWQRPPTPDDILRLAALVEPDHNTGRGFRLVNSAWRKALAEAQVPYNRAVSRAYDTYHNGPSPRRWAAYMKAKWKAYREECYRVLVAAFRGYKP